MQRRLSSNWRANEQPEADYAASHPMPDYVPANLFDDLSLPEMRLHLPQSAPSDLADEYMRVQQALSEFAPGKGFRRFTEAYCWGSMLRLCNPSGIRQRKSLSIGSRRSLIGTSWTPRDVHANIDGEAVTLYAYRPLGASLQEADGKQGIRVGDTSNAQVQWTTQLLRPHGGDCFDPPSHVGISTLIEEIQAHTHARQNAVVARRYAHSSRAELRLTHGQQSRRSLFTLTSWHAINPLALVLISKPTRSSWFSDYPPISMPPLFGHRSDSEPRGLLAITLKPRGGWRSRAAVPNLFMRNWIAQIFQIAAIIHARANGDLRAAMDELVEGAQSELLLSVLSSVFQAPESDEGSSDRLRENLYGSALKSAEILKFVRHAARVLVDPVDADWNDWLSLVLRTTLGAACLQGIQEACPQVDSDALVVDVEPGLQSDGSARERHELWISEVNPGGNGLIEQVVELLASQPDLLFRHIEAALGPQDLEFSTSQLRQMASWLGSDSEDNAVVEAVDLVRQATDAQSAQSRFGEL